MSCILTLRTSSSAMDQFTRLRNRVHHLRHGPDFADPRKLERTMPDFDLIRDDVPPSLFEKLHSVLSFAACDAPLHAPHPSYKQVELLLLTVYVDLILHRSKLRMESGFPLRLEPRFEREGEAMLQSLDSGRPGAERRGHSCPHRELARVVRAVRSRPGSTGRVLGGHGTSSAN